MPCKTPRERYENSRDRLKTRRENGDISTADYQAICELCDAYDENDITTPTPPGDSHRSVGTLGHYAYQLGILAERVELTDTDADAINQAMQELLDDGRAKSTIRTYQMAAKTFYRYHDFDTDPADIASVKQQGTKVSPDDMLTREEIQSLRDAADHPRDKAIIDLLLYTGQRSAAIRTLKIKHVNVKEGYFRLNKDADGLKGADENGDRRPLLMAAASVRNWLQYHPAGNDPNAYLITSKPGYNQVNPHEPVSHATLSYVTRKLSKEIGLEDKPNNPHSLRHNFVTIAKRDYGMDDAVIKYLIGHAPESKVMETTYAHLSDADYMDAAREAVGLKESDTESPLTPLSCGTCGENLEPHYKACPKCGTEITPDAAGSMDTIEEAVYESKGEADTDTEEESIDTVRDIIRNDPEAKATILEEMKDELLDELRDELAD